jgi:hypothetical protein
VVVEHGMYEGVSEFGVVPFASRLVGCGGAVLLTLSTADVTPAVAIGDVAQFFHVHVDEGTGVGVLVPTDWLSGCPVEIGQPVQACTGKDAMNRRRCNI